MQGPCRQCVKVQHIHKTFAGQPRAALQDISLTVDEGASLAIVGPNGAGKTTLLQCIAGLIRLDSGMLEIEAYEQNRRIAGSNCQEGIRYPRELRKRIGIVFQNSALWTHLSVLDNVVRPLIDIKRVDPDKAPGEARDLLVDHLQLDLEHLKKYPAQLSPGQARRVAFARAFAMDPTILLIDEIEASLDPDAVEVVLDCLYERFTRHDSKTVILITHRLNLLERIASQALFLDEGRMVALGSPERLLANNADNKLRKVRNAVTPARSGASLGMICLEQVFEILQSSQSDTHARGGEFQTVAEKVSNLVAAIDDDPSIDELSTRGDVDPRHLLLLVTKHGGQYWVKGLAVHHRVVLDGNDAEKLGDLVYKGDTGYEIHRDYREKIRYASVLLNVDDNRSLIVQMFRKEYLDIMSYTYAPKFDPIKGVYYTAIPPEDTALQRAYYAFSKGTKSVYLFPLEHRGTVIGVLSIDSHSIRKWPPFVVRELKMIANICAAAIARA